MLMEVKNQIKVTALSIKYSLMKQMLNKASFFSSIIFMILNNASFIIQWVIIYSLKDNIGGYELKHVLLLWGISAGTYGVSRFFFKNAFHLSEVITNGKLDAYLVQPKNILISAITGDVEVSAIGDMIYGYIMLFIFGFSLESFLTFTLFSICGGLILTSISIIYSSLSFWIGRADMVSDTANSLMIHFATYPDGIFKSVAKVILYTIVPVGVAAYLPVKTIISFDIYNFIIIITVTIVLVTIAFEVFYKGLKRYSSSNLMISRI